MSYALNIAEDGRYLSACDSDTWCPVGIPVVENLPTGETELEKDPNNWRYVDGVWIYDPLPEPDPEPFTPTLEDRVQSLEVTTDDVILMMAELIGG